MTRFYLPSTGTPDISPAFNAGWDVTTNADRRNMVTTRISSAMTNKAGVGDASQAEQLLRQYISAPLAAQTLTGNIKGVVRLASNVANVGMGALAFSLSKCNAAGDTVTEILSVRVPALATSAAPPATSGSTLTNRRFETPPDNTFSISVGSTSIDEGDRLIVEIGYKDNTADSGRHCIASFGDDNESDLVENETGTDAFNPWVEFSADITFASGGGAVTGSLAVTEEADTFAGAAAVLVAGDLEVTEGADTFAGEAAVLVAGALAVTEAADTFAAAADVLIAGALAVTEGADTLAATGAVLVSADLAVTEGADTFHATSGAVPIDGDLAVTEGADTFAGEAGVLVAGALAVTEAADTIAADAAVLVSGALAVTEGADTFFATTAERIVGALAVIEGADTFAADVDVVECVAVTLDVRNPDLGPVIGVAFLDRLGRFAKSLETFTTVRFFYPSNYCLQYQDLTRAQFNKLPLAKRREIEGGPSAAGLVDTEGKSNA